MQESSSSFINESYFTLTSELESDNHFVVDNGLSLNEESSQPNQQNQIPEHLKPFNPALVYEGTRPILQTYGSSSVNIMNELVNLFQGVDKIAVTWKHKKQYNLMTRKLLRMMSSNHSITEIESIYEPAEGESFMEGDTYERSSITLEESSRLFYKSWRYTRPEIYQILRGRNRQLNFGPDNQKRIFLGFDGVFRYKQLIEATVWQEAVFDEDVHRLDQFEGTPTSRTSIMQENFAPLWLFPQVNLILFGDRIPRYALPNEPTEFETFEEVESFFGCFYDRGCTELSSQAIESVNDLVSKYTGNEKDEYTIYDYLLMYEKYWVYK